LYPRLVKGTIACGACPPFHQARRSAPQEHAIYETLYFGVTTPAPIAD
jgi:hypothetical protein